MPQKIVRVDINSEIGDDVNNSFVAFINGKPQLVRYQDGFVGEEDDVTDKISDRLLKQDGAELREMTDEEELELLTQDDLSFDEKVMILQRHESKINSQLDKVISFNSFTRSVDIDE